MKVNKNGKEYPLGFMPEHYPADRVYLDGDISKTVQGAIDEVASDVDRKIEDISSKIICNVSNCALFAAKKGNVINISLDAWNDNGLPNGSVFLNIDASIYPSVLPANQYFGSGVARKTTDGSLILALAHLANQSQICIYYAENTTVEYVHADLTYKV